MKLVKKPTLSKIAGKTSEKKKTTKQEGTKKKTLPPDTYKDEITPIDIQIDENRKFVLSVKRGGDLGLPCVDFRQYQTTEAYEGFTKKGVNFPVEYLCDIITALQDVYEVCEKKGFLQE